MRLEQPSLDGLRVDVAAVELLDVVDAQQHEGRDELALQHADKLLNAFDAPRVREYGPVRFISFEYHKLKGQDLRAADTDTFRTEREEFDNVAAMTNTTVRIDLHPLDDLRCVFVDVEQNLNSSGSSLEETATVVADVDRLEPKLHAKFGILPGDDS